jgi:hypothetical protein
MLHNHKPSDYRRPRYVRPKDIPPVGRTFTITETEEIDKAVEGDEPDFRIRLTLDKWYWFDLSPGNFDCCIELFGDESFDSWIGKRLGLIIDQFQTKNDGMRTYIKVVPASEIEPKRRPVPSALKPRVAAEQDKEIQFG